MSVVGEIERMVNSYSREPLIAKCLSMRHIIERAGGWGPTVKNHIYMSGFTVATNYLHYYASSWYVARYVFYAAAVYNVNNTFHLIQYHSSLCHSLVGDY